MTLMHPLRREVAFSPPFRFENLPCMTSLPAYSIVIFSFPLTAYQGIANSKSRRLSPDRGSAVARDMSNVQRTGRLTRGDDCVESVCVEPVLGGQRGFGGFAEREVAGAGEDE